MLVVTQTLKVPLREIRFSFARSSGPGGQNVNKVNTKAVLRWSIARSKSVPASVRDRFVARHGRRITKDGDIVIASSRFRDQGRNVADCLERLRGMLASVAQPPKRRKKTKPSRAAAARRLAAKRARSRTKQQRQRPGRHDD